MNLQNTIKLNREKKGLTQEELAKKLNMTKQSVSFWETGRSRPSMSIVLELEKILGVDLMPLYQVEEPGEQYISKIDLVLEELEKISRQNSEILEYYMDMVKENFKYKSVSRKLIEEASKYTLPERIKFLISELNID